MWFKIKRLNNFTFSFGCFMRMIWRSRDRPKIWLLQGSSGRGFSARTTIVAFAYNLKEVRTAIYLSTWTIVVAAVQRPGNEWVIVLWSIVETCTLVNVWSMAHHLLRLTTARETDRTWDIGGFGFSDAWNVNTECKKYTL